MSQTAWHVGRSGEVAGGMTQVINGYLGWDFDGFDVRVITSRDGSRGIRSLLIFAGALRRILLLGGQRSAVVVVHLSQGGSFHREGVLLRLARRRGFGTVAQLHGSSFAEFAARRPVLVAKVLVNATMVLALSEETRAMAATFVGDDRVTLLPNAVPSGTPVEKEKLVVFGGAVTHRKGVDVLVDAWRRVGAGSGWTLTVAGPVRDPEVVPASLDDASFVGSVDHGELMALLDRSAIAILPSRDEAMPMFILEALARDNCVIATSVGGIPAVLANGRGLLVPPGNAAALSEALHSALTDDTLRRATARAGRAEFDAAYSAKTVYPKLALLWRDAIAAR